VVARVTVTLPDDVLERLDAVAADEDTSRSEVVREAAVSYLATRESGAETRARAAAVTDGLAWLEDVARKPSADPRSTVDILRETRELDGGLVESAPPDVRPSRR
jgi:Arc/MetJ-type ribon-helix-helix transcriptional regulator